MSDLVERLRKHGGVPYDLSSWPSDDLDELCCILCATMIEAADRIEELEDRVDGLSDE